MGLLGKSKRRVIIGDGFGSFKEKALKGARGKGGATAGSRLTDGKTRVGRAKDVGGFSTISGVPS